MCYYITNLPFTLIDLSFIDNKLAHNVFIKKVVKVINTISPFISSPLGLVLNHNGDF